MRRKFEGLEVGLVVAFIIAEKVRVTCHEVRIVTNVGVQKCFLL
jgi:hypothetical protein